MPRRGSRVLYNHIKHLKKQEILNLARQTCKCGHSYLEHFKCYQEETGNIERIGFLDIETSNLSADFGIIFSYAIKELGGKIIGRTVTPNEMRTEMYDKKLMEEAVAHILGFNRICTYYGSRFDIPFLRARALYHGLDFPLYKEVYHTDVYYMAKNRLCISRKRLETVCDFLGIPAKAHKLNQVMWLKALGGNPKALDFIWKHNTEDVISLEQVWKRLDSYCQPTNRSI